jgi:glycosyltransferase involved in cell wall biosynthesis
MKIAMLLPGGVDRSGEVRVIPAFLSLIERLARAHELHVFALHQEARPATWMLRGAMVHNAGFSATAWHTLAPLLAEHRRAPFDVVQSLFSGKPGALAWLAARLLRLPLAVHVTGGELKNLPGYGGSRGWTGRWREAIVLRGADAVTAPSAPMISDLENLGIAARRIPVGVDLTLWRPRAPRRREPTAPARLVHVGSLNRVKDQPTLLQALRDVVALGHEFHLDIVGEDTLGGSTRRLSAELGLAHRVRWRGFLRQGPLRELMSQADLCVMSSLHEAGPVAMLEAATLGIPTVGTRVGHVAEFAPEAAVATPVGDASALGSAIAALLADDERRCELGRQAQLRALAEDADHTGRAFECLYERLVARHQRS